ncbi:hypothetical protein Cgig2_011001 [Carnegiea gigantea]|uniref:Endonuclease/exonuclease/phosphatase n=1 Tax=Carnegiea gigantea TaxID=171969 RepID=A0A9Q1KH41_9CARY|nr:hypothetical protein Cgig2_011001 [Carnegiea gigantea]
MADTDADMEVSFQEGGENNKNYPNAGTMAEGLSRNAGGLSYRDTLQRNNPEVTFNVVQNAIREDNSQGDFKSGDDEPQKRKTQPSNVQNRETNLSNSENQGSRFRALAEDRHTADEPPSHVNVTIMVWNVRGAGNREFLSMLKEHIRMQESHVISLLETHISGSKADEMKGVRPWLFATIYASLTLQLQEELWTELSQFMYSIEAPWMLTGDFNET